MNIAITAGIAIMAFLAGWIIATSKCSQGCDNCDALKNMQDDLKVMEEKYEAARADCKVLYGDLIREKRSKAQVQGEYRRSLLGIVER
jgi:hypothetical protein